MMDVLKFGTEVVSLSASGVLAPGPLLFANLACATHQGKWSGIKVSCGHAIVEVLLIIIISTGIFTIDAAKKYTSTISLMGGVAILVFAGSQIATLLLKKNLQDGTRSIAGNNSPFFVGISFSALNPFFILWWLTAGLKLISDSAEFGVITGLIILFAAHIWMDYAWLALTAYLSSKGSSLLNSQLYRVILLGLASLLVYYGISFIVQGLSLQTN
jgi:threonine/homoserine/homoserine lactone efflux protein